MLSDPAASIRAPFAVASWAIMLGFASAVAAEPTPASGYVGDATCISCHASQGAQFAKTAHHNTSSLPSSATIHGRFDPGGNVLRSINNPQLHFEMEATPEGFTQTAKIRISAKQILARTEKFGVVIGSGRKGQTYLFWDGDQLFELPVSYWTGLNAWINSPSYPDGTASFERPVLPRCLECHATSFKSTSPTTNHFETSTLMLGVHCEKCHGPGGEHVARMKSATPPRTSPLMAIVNPARLPRERQIDICALCHAGIGNSIDPPLSFVPGQDLSRHLQFPVLDESAPIDVHASQVQLLQRSRCYRESPNLTCATCHDVHRTQREVTEFAADCCKCHTVESCRKFPALGRAIANDCVRCHMPDQQTNQIVASLNGQSLQPKVRNHHIAIYPEAAAP